MCRETYNSDGLFWASDSDSDGNRAVGALRPGRASRYVLSDRIEELDGLCDLPVIGT